MTTTPCPCTKIEQDPSCPIGFPSLLCEICDGKGHIEAASIQIHRDLRRRHIVLTARMIAAIDDWRDHLREFDPQSATGISTDGRLILFRSSENPSSLYGISADSYSTHASAHRLGRTARDRLQHCRKIMEQRRIPQIDDIAARSE